MKLVPALTVGFLASELAVLVFYRPFCLIITKILISSLFYQIVSIISNGIDYGWYFKLCWESIKHETIKDKRYQGFLDMIVYQQEEK